MPDQPQNLLDIIAQLQQLQHENRALKEQLNTLSKVLNPENLQELILYRPHDSNRPVELTWSDEEDEKTREYYRTEEPMRRDVIGLLINPESR